MFHSRKFTYVLWCLSFFVLPCMLFGNSLIFYQAPMQTRWDIFRITPFLFWFWPYFTLFTPLFTHLHDTLYLSRYLYLHPLLPFFIFSQRRWALCRSIYRFNWQLTKKRGVYWTLAIGGLECWSWRLNTWGHCYSSLLLAMHRHCIGIGIIGCFFWKIRGDNDCQFLKRHSRPVLLLLDLKSS